MPNRMKIKEEKTSLSKKALIKKYQYLVKKIARQFKNASEPIENLEEVGYIGLLNAVNLYDEKWQKIDFRDYAQVMITEEIHQYLVNHNRQVDRPDWLIRLNQKIDEFVIHYQREHRHFPKISEIASKINIHLDGLEEVLKARDSLMESYFLPETGQDAELSPVVPNLEKIRDQSFKSFKLPIRDLVTLYKALKRLRKLQESIIYYLFIMDLSQTRLAKMLGISQEKANQIKKDAYRQLQ